MTYSDKMYTYEYVKKNDEYVITVYDKRTKCEVEYNYNPELIKLYVENGVFNFVEFCQDVVKYDANNENWYDIAYDEYGPPLGC